MTALQKLLALNGLVFLLRAALNVLRPTSFYLSPGAPENAEDAVRVLGITYAAVGVVQLGAARSVDRTALRIVATGSALFAGGVALQAISQSSSPPDAFHRIRVASAVENVLVAGLYLALLLRERRESVSPS